MLAPPFTWRRRAARPCSLRAGGGPHTPASPVARVPPRFAPLPRAARPTPVASRQHVGVRATRSSHAPARADKGRGALQREGSLSYGVSSGSNSLLKAQRASGRDLKGRPRTNGGPANADQHPVAASFASCSRYFLMPAPPFPGGAVRPVRARFAARGRGPSHAGLAPGREGPAELAPLPLSGIGNAPRDRRGAGLRESAHALRRARWFTTS